MPPLFGTEGIINHVTLIVSAGFILVALVFRKNIANDVLDFPFSVIGSSAISIFSFILMDIIFGVIKWSIAVSLIGWLVGGFLLAPIVGDGESS